MFDGLADLARKRSKEKFFSGYMRLMHKTELGDRIVKYAAKNKSQELISVKSFISTIFQRYKFDLGSIHDLWFLYEISRLIPEATLGERFRGEMLDRVFNLQNREERYQLLYLDPRTRRHGDYQRREEYLNSEINKLDELERLKKDVLAMFDFSPSAAVGELVVADLLEQQAKGKRELFKLLMASDHSEKEIRVLLFKLSKEKYWFVLERFPNISSFLFLSNSVFNNMFIFFSPSENEVSQPLTACIPHNIQNDMKNSVINIAGIFLKV